MTSSKKSLTDLAALSLQISLLVPSPRSCCRHVCDLHCLGFRFLQLAFNVLQSNPMVRQLLVQLGLLFAETVHLCKCILLGPLNALEMGFG